VTKFTRSFMLLANISLLEKDYANCLKHREPIEALLAEDDSLRFDMMGLCASCHTELEVWRVLAEFDLF
jgi:hypothetical protein